MNQDLQNALTFLVYALLLAGCIVGEHYGILDVNLASGLIGAILTHLGVNYVPVVNKTLTVLNNTSEILKTTKNEEPPHVS
jgi:hypothetical protein